MKLFIDIKKMTFIEESNLIEHDIVLRVSDEDFYGYDYLIDLSENDKFVKNTLKNIYKKDKCRKDTKEIERKVFKVREENTWWNFPFYEIKDGKIIPFDYNQYSYFVGTDRRMALASKINQLYNPPSESKIIRKTLKYIMDNLDIKYPDFFKKYNGRIEATINKNPKGNK